MFKKKIIPLYGLKWIQQHGCHQASLIMHLCQIPSLCLGDRVLRFTRQWHPTPVLLPGKSHGQRSLVGCSPWGREELDTTEWLQFHFSLYVLEKVMATHSDVLAWRIPGMGEPGELPSMGSHRVGHDWSYLAAAGKIYKLRYGWYQPQTNNGN